MQQKTLGNFLITRERVVRMSSNPELIQSVLKALQIMEQLDKHGSLGIREMAQKLGFGKSSVHRIVSTLKYAGWVVENTSTGKNELSYKLFSIGNNVVKRINDIDSTHKEMQHLSDETGENVNLGVLFRGEVFHIDKVVSKSPIKVDVSIGTPTTSYNTALGKVLLARMSDTQVRDLFKDYKFTKTGKNTILNLESLIAELQKIRIQGYACDNEEYAEGMICYAVVINNPKWEIERALSVSFPKYRYEKEPQKMQFILERLQETGQRLSRI